MPVKDNVVLYESFSGAGLIDSPFVFFKNFLTREDFEFYTHIWVVKDFKDIEQEILEYCALPNVRFVKYGSDNYLKYISIAKYLFNNNTFPTYWTKKPEQIYINTWHGVPRKKLFFDIPNKEMETANVIRNFLSANYLLANCQQELDMYLKAAKLDGLCNKKIIYSYNLRYELIKPAKEAEKLLKDKCNIVLSNKKIALYAPTWRNDLKNSVDEKIIKILESKGYQVLVKAHHVDYENNHKYIPASIDAVNLFSVCDLLVTDYSSIYYDWAEFTNKPVVFYCPDYEQYCEEQGLYENFPCAFAENYQSFEYLLTNLREYWSKVQNSIWAQTRNLIETRTQFSVDTILSYLLNNEEEMLDLIQDYSIEKEKLLFYAGDFKPNGVTSSILALFNNIDYSRYDVSLILLKNNNPDYIEKIKEINSHVRLLVRAGTYSQTLLEHCANEICLKKGIETFEQKKMLPRGLYRREWNRCFGDTIFDKVINFTGYSPFYTFFFAVAPATSKKIIWQHNIMKLDQMREVNGNYPLKDSLNTVFTVYPDYDTIVSVSSQCGEKNKRDFNFKENEIKIVPNCVPNKSELISKMRMEDSSFSYNPEEIRYLNVARLSPAKNQISLIRAFKKFHIKYGCAHLYIMGDGELKSELIKEIGQDNDFIHLIPYNKDPFVNMSVANYVILPSNYEGQGLAAIEAKILDTKTIVTDFGKTEGVTDVADILINEPDVFNIEVALEHSMQELFKKIVPFNSKEYNKKAIEAFYKAIS